MHAAFSIVAYLALVAGAASEGPVYEMRTYYPAEGKMEALHARFRDHTCKLFEKHGITNVGYWVPIDAPDSKLVYVLAYPSREARAESWQAFIDDPDWKAARAASEVNGKLVARVESVFMTATDFSPELKVADVGDRVFEMRTYTATPGNLPALHARFRDHTCKLFEKHGMTNVVYWQLMPDQPEADKMLIYLLAHKSRDAAQESFAAFRVDPAWVSARTESESRAGGSLTAPGGVVSEFLKPTDYSPLK